MFDFSVIPVSDQLTDEDQLELDRLVDSDNMQRSGIEDARLMSIMVRSTGGELLAGLHGYTWGGYCEVKGLWVAAGLRGQGLGGALLRSAEKEATRRGCRILLLATHSFQAPDFYRRHHYNEVATVDNCPIGHSYILMSKALGCPKAGARRGSSHLRS